MFSRYLSENKIFFIEKQEPFDKLIVHKRNYLI